MRARTSRPTTMPSDLWRLMTPARAAGPRGAISSQQAEDDLDEEENAN